MGKHPRTRRQLLPPLERIHQIWVNFRNPPKLSIRLLRFPRKVVASSSRMPRKVIASLSRMPRKVTASLLTAISILAFPVLIAIALFTGVERTVSKPATWEIIDREGTIKLRLADAKNLEAELVISDRLRRYLQDKNPDSVNVTFRAVFDLGIMRDRGPILTVDGISLDD